MSEQRHDKANVQVQGTNSRRRFIKKASVGAAISMIPAKSVWATDFANSIVASGHGSDFANGTPLSLLSQGFWKNSGKGETDNYTFLATFGGLPRHMGLNLSGNLSYKIKNGPVQTVAVESANLLQVLWAHGTKIDGVYRQIIAMYLNAKYHEESGYNLYFPAVNGDTGRPFKYLDNLAMGNESFAYWLYDKATTTPNFGNDFNNELAGLIETFHATETDPDYGYIQS